MKIALTFLFVLFSQFHNLLAAEENIDFYYSLAKKKCSDISCIRREMDRINDQILILLTERAALALRAGDIKLDTSRKAGTNLSSIKADDKKRRDQQALEIAKRSKELGLPQYISEPTFNEIMINTVRFQQEYLDNLIKKLPDQN